MGCKPYSNFNLVGAAQVGKSSLTGMRVLHRLAGRLPVWPVDPLPARGSVVVEIYTTIAALAAGRPPSQQQDAQLSPSSTRRSPRSDRRRSRGAGPLDDHSADALLTAAWLRTVADRAELWHPQAHDRRASPAPKAGPSASLDAKRRRAWAGLAQLVEHLICNQGVAGSNPSSRHHHWTGATRR